MVVTDTHRDPAALVRSLRDLLGLSQEKFAARLGVTFSSVNRWENGHRKPSPLAMKQVEAILLEIGPVGKELHDEYFGT
ncbi:helix-turn-helix domain-containing protein [Neorhodopirellula lusitana]|uniref:helix-turn-helix domain-containing protein n=1 Tax=Neorhodopirellula lusitana TaxID=445327 RepID=UPI00384ACD59